MSEINNLLNNITNIKTDIKSAIENKGQNVTNFASYPNAILNIQSQPTQAEGDILLFSNINEMLNTTVNDETLALVYNTHSNNIQGLFIYMNNTWEIPDTGLTALKEYTNSAIIWGINGVEQGTLYNIENVSVEDARAKVYVYNTYKSLSLNTTITNLSNIFKDYNHLVKIPTINANNVLDLSGAFSNCYNLVDINTITMPKVINIENIFYNCTNLSSKSYDNIVNCLPETTNLTNKYFASTGLNISKLTNEHLFILNSKGYLDIII